MLSVIKSSALTQMKKELEDVCRVRVKFSEMDPMNIVWHGSYVKYLEDGRESFGRHYPGIDYQTMEAAHQPAPVYDVHLKYFASLGFNDIAEIHTFYVYHRGARLDYRYEIYRERDHALCIKAETTQLFIDAHGELMIDKPEYFARWQQKYLMSGSPEEQS